MQFSKDIAINEEFNEEDTYIATLCGLLHDYGRFTQWRDYHTFQDSKSFDHGDKSYEILKEMINEYTENKEIQNIVLLACKYHNKLTIPDNLDERTIKFCKLVRDADKIDIMIEQNNILYDNYYTKEALENIMNYRMVENNNCNSDIDAALRLLAFIFDINYQYTYKLIKDKNIIENKINIIENKINEDFSNLKNILINYVKERF